ncbi:MAG TPA: hypothetical protein VF179_00040 [Thermoanaerobaculia bacterium]|nr:hypothetical protein [Thermoanaerobaculia bacterium]
MNFKDLVFSLEVKTTPTKAALQLRDLQTQLLSDEAAFDCGRTNQPPSRLDVYRPDVDTLKAALRKMLVELEKVT